MARILWISLFVISTSLIVGGCGGSSSDVVRCVCDFNIDSDGDEKADTEICLDMACTGDGCGTCACTLEELVGEEVGSCEGTVAGSTTEVEDNVSAEITCYASNEAGTALCQQMSAEGIQ